MAKNILAVILGGGKGTKLRPLTEYRTKPAVPIGGKYRLIDVPVSNCLNSGITKIYILTQFSSQSMHSHIAETYKMDYFTKGFVRILAAEQSVKTSDWYQGTADSVRKNIIHLKSTSQEDDLVLILSGDQLYKMDFNKIIEQHIKTKADLTICSKIVDKTTAKKCGIMQIDKNNKITTFTEKPSTKEQFDNFKTKDNHFLASMGIYVFKRSLLFNVLKNSQEDDFGRGIIPKIISKATLNTYAYKFDKYWEDIGTIKAFYEANLGIASGKIDFNFNKIYTHPRFLPPSQIIKSSINHSMIAEGCIINSANISNSLIGLRSFVGNKCEISDSIIMGTDFYENKKELAENKKNKLPNIGIGNNVIIKKAIIDKNAKIGNNVKIENKNNIKNLKTDTYVIKDGIIIIPKNSVIPNNTVI